MRVLEWCSTCGGLTDHCGTRCLRCGHREGWPCLWWMLALLLCLSLPARAASTDPVRDLRPPIRRDIKPVKHRPPLPARKRPSQGPGWCMRGASWIG